MGKSAETQFLRPNIVGGGSGGGSGGVSGSVFVGMPLSNIRFVMS